MKKIAFSGSFDPITKGHLWVVQEALNLGITQQVVIMMAVNPNKKYYFSEKERLDIINSSLKELGIEKKVKVVVIRNEYVAQSALEHGCECIIRGLRSALDFDYEALIQKANVEVLEGAKTIFLMPPRDLESVSSSFVKSLLGPVGWHQKIKDFVSVGGYEALINKYLKNCIANLTDLNLKEEQLNDLITILNNQYKGRAYHNLDHIAHCYQELEWAISNFNLEKDEYKNVAIAIFAHDIIYGEKKETSDEKLSAQWLQDYLQSIGHEDLSSVRIVLSTEHASYKEEKSKEEKLMHDIDLAILGSSKKMYQKYTKEIREEYNYVENEKYKEGRLKILNILKSKKIYLTNYFVKYSNSAKTNLENEIKELEE
jgi:pantetheine-phosphate adenylyltransferase